MIGVIGIFVCRFVGLGYLFCFVFGGGEMLINKVIYLSDMRIIVGRSDICVKGYNDIIGKKNVFFEGKGDV